MVVYFNACHTNAPIFCDLGGSAGRRNDASIELLIRLHDSNPSGEPLVVNALVNM